MSWRAGTLGKQEQPLPKLRWIAPWGTESRQGACPDTLLLSFRPTSLSALTRPPWWHTLRRHYYNVARNIGARPGHYWPDQFENLCNFRAHFEGTAPEIWEQAAGEVDGFICAGGFSREHLLPAPSPLPPTATHPFPVHCLHASRHRRHYWRLHSVFQDPSQERSGTHRVP